MIAYISDVFGSSVLEAVALTGQESLILLTVLAIGSALTGGLPILSSPLFEFSLNKAFILSLFFLRSQDPTVYFAFASILAGIMLRRTVSGMEFWRYVTTGITMVVLLKYGPTLFQKFQPGIQDQIAIIAVIPIIIFFEIIINIVCTRKGSNISMLSGIVLISYIAAIPLSIMIVIMVIHQGILGAALAFAGLAGFSFIGRSISRKHQWNTQRIMEISRQDRMAVRLMGSSSYEEFLGVLQNSLFETEDSSIRALTRSSGSYDWVLWSTDEQQSLQESSIIGILPAKGRFTRDFTVKSISGTALGLSDNGDLIIVLSGPEQNILQSISSGLLENLVLLLGHTWEAVGHYLRSERSFLAAAVTLARLADSKDNYTYGHSLRVAGLSSSLGRYLHISPESMQILRVAAILHDIGKLVIPAAILTKRGLLTKKEREIVEAHPLEGARIVSGLSGYEEVARIVKSHHERLDGTGYPDGVCSVDIPFIARIVAVADTFDAITSDRSYRSISGSDNALEILREEKGSKFDSRVVSALEAILSNESAGMA